MPYIDNLHNISVNIMKDKTLIQFHFDVPPETTLEIAHELATQIEEKIEEEFPIALRKNLDIISHIEPTQHLPGKVHSHSVRPIPSNTQDLIEMALKHTLQIKKWDHLNVIQEEGNSSISLTIYLDGTINIAEVHHITEDIEAEFRKIMPYLKLCIIHSAPFTSK
jgi:divalent metal cation (Fe/Co/Zn/Cd) transporter